MNSFTFDTITRIIKPIKIIGRKYFQQPIRFSIDSRAIQPKDGFIALKGTLRDGHEFIKEAVSKKVTVVIGEKREYSKDLPACVFIVRSSYQALKNICRFLNAHACVRKVAITGSVGKTTTKEMLVFLLHSKGEVLKNTRTENNFLGVCKTLLKLDDRYDFLVMELGTNAPGEIKTLASIVKPDVGVITFIKPVHIAGLPTLKDIFEEKKQILYSKKHIIGIVNKDDPWLRKVKNTTSLYWFGKTRSADLYAKCIRSDESESIFMVNSRYYLRLKTPCHFFIYNALAAILAAKIVGVDVESSIRIMEEFSLFPPMRMEKTIKGEVLFINDAYNSNPFSLKEGLKIVDVFSYPKIAVIGDMLELGEKSAYFHKHVAGEFLKHKFKYIFTFGRESLFLKEKLISLGYKNAFHFDSHKKLILSIKKAINKKKYLVFVKGSRKMEMERIIKGF